MTTLNLSERDVGRLLSVVRERRRKLERGMEKFSTNFDPVLGKNMKEGLDAYVALEASLKEQMR